MKKHPILKVILWIVFLPIMIIIVIWKSRMKVLWKLILTVIVLAICLGAYNSDNQPKGEPTRSSTTVSTSEPSNEEAESLLIPVTVEPTEIPIDTILLSQEYYEIPVGGSFSIDFTYEPQDATNTAVTIQPSNGYVAIKDYTVTSKEAGDTEIILSQNDAVLATLKVHSFIIDVESVEFSDSPLEAWIGRSIKIPLSVFPEEASWELIQFQSSNPDILKIDDTGERGSITAVGVSSGRAIITATYKNGEATANSGEITVSEVLPSELRIVLNSPTLHVGDKGSFSVSFDPKDVSDSTVTWKSSNTHVLKVEADGSYEAIALGTAEISASYKTGITATLPVEVQPTEAKRITITSSWPEGEKFIKGKQLTLSAVFDPATTTNQHVTWASDDETIAKVNDRGIVTALTPGIATITATADNGVVGRYLLEVSVSPQKFYVSISAQMTENNSVGGKWSKEFYLNSEPLRSGSYVLITPGENFSVEAIITENDANPDTGFSSQKYTLTNEMCIDGFTFEDQIGVRENGGRYSGHYAYWTVKITFKPV